MSTHPDVYGANATTVRIGNSIEDIAADLLKNLFCMQGKFSEVATPNDWYLALAYTVRDRMLHRWIQTASTYFEQKSRTLVYLSAEFLLGPQLEQNLVNLGMYHQVQAAVERLRQECGQRLPFALSLDLLLEQEEEPGLGSGGLGRLAACYMDSLATLQIPTIGYGLRYEFGVFAQEISSDGWQVEKTDKWLRLGNPWEIARPEITFEVKLGGHSEPYVDESGRYCVRWIPDKVILGTPHDMPVLGSGVNNANLLCLWRAEACESFDFQAFNIGDYYRAVDEKIYSENITKVLYPNDEPLAGKQLRLEQQYFFVSCSLQDMIRIYLQREQTFDNFPAKYVVQLNDTHPAVAVAELMRLLVDVHRMDWEPAWEITRQTFAYTNHTLLPEALEKWPLPLFAHVLPRHLEIIYEIKTSGFVPRTFFFGGKAAPGYFMARLIIRLINGVAEVVNADPDVNQYLRVLFFPNFNVKQAQYIYPAADLSEQISTAGKEASGTGNMKFALNGALTIGTLDGANVEIRAAVGADNFFCFGLTADEVQRSRSEGYRPREVYERNASLHEAIDLIASGTFARGDRNLFQPLVHALLDYDEYMLCADYSLYLACQEQVSAAWGDLARWTKMSILNVARMGYFSSDRAIKEYCTDIWKVEPVRVELSAR